MASSLWLSLSSIVFEHLLWNHLMKGDPNIVLMVQSGHMTKMAAMPIYGKNLLLWNW